MAVEPLFVETRTKLFERIRLEEPKTTDSTAQMVDRTMQQVRIRLYERLTADTVTEILAIVSTENPTTVDELRRVNAELVEQLWVEYLLKKYLPVSVFDANTSTPPNQIWNKEPLTRDIDPDLWEEHLEALWEEIQDLLDLISEKDSSFVNASTIGPDDFDYPRDPGASIVYGGSGQPYSGFNKEDVT